VTDLLELTAVQGTAAIERGEISSTELRDAWRDAAAADELNAYLTQVEAAATAARRCAIPRSRSASCAIAPRRWPRTLC